MKATGEIAPKEDLYPAVTPEAQRAQLERVLRSEVFTQAPVLQKFLEFVGSKAIGGLTHEIKEYTIGTEVFGRSSGYDPRIDTVVRVQAHRLREKLREYYDGEGAADQILILIPKGHYVPRFSRRAAAAERGFAAPQSPGPPSEAQEEKKQALAPQPAGGPNLASVAGPRKGSSLRLLVGLAGAALLAGAGLLLFHLRTHRPSEVPSRAPIGIASTTKVYDPLEDLWADFLKGESSPIIAYSNTVFLATQTSDLLRLKSEDVDNLGATASAGVASRLAANPRLLDRAGPLVFEDVYTGTGEVMAVFDLTRLFTQLHSSLEVKRSRLVTTDDLSRHDLIFLGSTRENALLAQLPLIQDFVFDWPTQRLGVWNGRIMNLHSQPGERPSYEVERDPQTHVVRADYTLVSFLPGTAPNRKIAVLGGLTTLGTQAAAHFATSRPQIAELAARLEPGPATRSGKIPPYFQALLRVEIMKGDILSVKYVTGHVIHAVQQPSPKN